MEQGILTRLNARRKCRQAVILLKNIDTGETQLIGEGDAVAEELSVPTRQAFHNGKSALHEIDGQQYFLNVYLPPTRLVVIGAVHISQHLSQIAASTGFDMEIIDPRTAFASPQRFSNSKLFGDWPQEVLGQNPLDPYCALIALTHDPKIDDFAIEAALAAECFYVGALGSRKTHAKRVERLGENGVTSEALAKINAPIGLDIGAANPAEIAVAILAEVINSFRRRGSA